MTRRLDHYLALAIASVLFAACSGGGDSEPIPPNVAPNHVLLTEQGERYALLVVDADGNPVTEGVTWESSSGDVRVDASGMVSAAGG